MHAAHKMKAWCIAEQPRYITYTIGGFIVILVYLDFVHQR